MTAGPNGRFVSVGGVRLHIRFLPGDAELPTLVLLHEGLGSVEMWRDFPDRLAAATRAPVMAYSRRGYGRSAPREGPYAPDYMHREAREALPEALAALGVARPILIGHSDGASIALIAAGEGVVEVSGLVLLAPHLFVEEITVAAIERAREAARSSDLIARLGRYHVDPAHAFSGWCEAWLSAGFRDWRIDDAVAGVAAPVLAIQGEDDEYGTLAQLDALEAAVKGRLARLALPACGHSPHRDQPEAVIAAIAQFIASN